MARGACQPLRGHDEAAGEKGKDSKTSILQLKERVVELERKAIEDVGIDSGGEASVTGPEVEKNRNDSSTGRTQAIIDLQQEVAKLRADLLRRTNCTADQS